VRSYREKFDGLDRLAESRKYGAIEKALYIRIAGFDDPIKTLRGFPRPFGMDEEEFTHRNCRYLQAVGQIFPHGRDEKWNELSRKNDALSSLFEKFNARYVNEVVRCTPQYPSLESQAMFDALTWAKGLAQMPPAGLRQLADKHFEKSGAVDKDVFKPSVDYSNLEDELEAVFQFFLAETIKRFTKFWEAEIAQN
jgi:hypothetical protein